MMLVLKRVVPLVLFLLVLTRVNAIWSDYRTATTDVEPSATTQEATSSVEATEASGGTEGSADEQATEGSAEETVTSGQTQVVVVVIPGLNFRSEPKSSSEIMRTLPEGTRLTLLGEQSGWYEVRDEDGVTGWVSASSQYVRLESE